MRICHDIFSSHLITPRLAPSEVESRTSRLLCASRRAPWTSLTRLAATILLCSAAVACGKKGPPRPPLNLVSDAPQSVSGRRLGDAEFLQMTVPTKNANGPGPVALQRLEIYAATVAADVPVPSNKDLLKPAYIIGHIDVRPPVDPDAPVEDTPDNDMRPRPGDVVSFIETLTAAQSTPQILAKPPDKKAQRAAKKKGRGAAPPPGAPVAPPAAPTTVPVPVRVYLIRGMSPKGRPGAPSGRVTVPLVTPPPAIPAAPQVTASQTAVTLSWAPPPSSTDEALGVTYNVYTAPLETAAATAAPTQPKAPAPLNPAPIDALTFDHPGAEPGKEQCFVVRTVATVAGVPIESDPSPRACITPRDIYPPAPPKNLAVVPSGGGRMNLIWDANTEPDLAGYMVLRGEAPGDTLQPLTPTPIKEARYTDETAKPGVTYVYAVVALDNATPPNRSAMSNKVTETAR